MSTIPANLFVNVIPGVVTAGGDALDLIGLVLSTSDRVPIGTVKSFPDAASVGDFFGLGSTEYRIAGGGAGYGSGYFGGFTNADAVPGSILFAQYNQAPVSAYLWGGNVSSMTLAQLKAITGGVSVVVDGLTYAAASLDLSGDSSFSAAAATIATALNLTPPTGPAFTGVISSTTLTASAVTGSIAPGQTVSGAGVTSGTVILAQLTGSTPGGAGTYSVNHSQSVASEAMTALAAVAVAYDSTSGAFVITSGTTGPLSTAAFATGAGAISLGLTSATGAYLSQGAAAADPATFMAGIVNVTQNWATFMTAFDPDGGSGNTVKTEFAAWVDGTNNRYAYVCWDPDVTPSESVPATGSMGYLLAQAGYSGTCLIWSPTDYNYAAFVCGMIAAINFEEEGGRITAAYKSQPGLIANVTTEEVAVNLGGNPLVEGSFGNGYNYYGAVATANQGFVFFQRGAISGEFGWLDAYVNQIWLNNACQLSLMEYLTNVKSVQYTTNGYGQIEEALGDPITAALNFGAIVPGVPLSAAQISEVNAAAGSNIAPVLASRGWYLQIKPASPTARGSRTSPPMTLWYTDGGSIQALQLSSILVQ